MTLLKTALKNIKQNPVMNIICLAQLTAVFLITAVMVSTMSIRYRTYTPIKSMLESKGFFGNYDAFSGITKPGEALIQNGIFYKDELLKYMNADKILMIHRVPIGHEKKTAQIYLYDRELIERYTPELKRGRWISPDADELEIVISEGVFGLDAGDEAEVDFILNTKDGKPVKVRVAGVLEDTAGIFGEPRLGSDIEDSYRRLYCPQNSIGPPIALASTDALQRLYPQIVNMQTHSVFYMYDDITDEELKQEMNLAGQMSGRTILSFDEINRNSRKFLKNELLKLLPVTVILLILVIISSISVSALSTRQRLGDFAKYYLLGLQWRQCAIVNLFQALTVGAAALLIACAGLIIVGAMGITDMLTIIWNAPLFLSLIGVFALYLVFSMIMPMLMLRSNSPKALLRAE